MSAMPAVIYWVTGLTGRGDHMAISIGTLVAFTTLQQSLYRPAVQLLSVGVDIQSSLELFGRIFEYLDLPADIAEPAHPVALGKVRGEVRLNDVSFSYAGPSDGGHRAPHAARHRRHRAGRETASRSSARPAQARPRSAT